MTLLAPLACACPGGSRSFVAAVGRCRTGSNIWVGADVLCFAVAGSVPSDPRLSHNIGNQGIRQRRKSTKTGEAGKPPQGSGRAGCEACRFTAVTKPTGGENMPASAAPWADGAAVCGRRRATLSRFPPGKRAPPGRGCTLTAHVFRRLVSYRHAHLLEKLSPVARLPRVTGPVSAPQRQPERPDLPIARPGATAGVMLRFARRAKPAYEAQPLQPIERHHDQN